MKRKILNPDPQEKKLHQVEEKIMEKEMKEEIQEELLESPPEEPINTEDNE